MATGKTAKKASDTPKKTSSRAKTSPKKEAASSKTTSKKFTIGDLRSKISQPANRKTLILAAGIIALAVVAYFAKGLLVAATVNGQPISRLAVIRDLESQSGQMSLDAMITRALVFQEAEKKNVEATDQEIDAEIAKIEKQFSDQGQNLDQLLSAQGLSREKFSEEVRIQILVTKLLGDQAKVSDKEFNEFMANNQDLLENEENKEAAQASLRQQMEQQKLAQKYQEWIANVKKNAKINYFVNY